jgi:hypothetical protein
MKMQGETLEYLRNSLQSMDVKDLILMDEKLLNLNQKLEEEKQEMKRDPNRKNNLSKILMSILAIDGLALSAISMVAMVDTPTSKIENIFFLAHLLLSGFLVTGISARELQRIEDSEFEINKDIEVLEKVQQVVNEFRHSLNQKRRISAVA